VKAALDGCKLSYAFVSPSQAVDAAVAALARGHLVGWFDGRMEWGHRSLGHRSILADPTSRYVLDNLNPPLRKRPRSRAFGVSVCEDTVSSLFCGPAASPFMQFEYGLRDDRLRHVLPAGATSIRVQTVTPETGTFWTLHNRGARQHVPERIPRADRLQPARCHPRVLRHRPRHAGDGPLRPEQVAPCMNW
jgi:predicted NodU family carbamoyl transferase